MTAPYPKQFRRSGAGASCGAQAEQDAPHLPPIVKLIMAEILARKFYIRGVAMSVHSACPSIVNALFESAAQEAKARRFGGAKPAHPAKRKPSRMRHRFESRK